MNEKNNIINMKTINDIKKLRGVDIVRTSLRMLPNHNITGIEDLMDIYEIYNLRLYKIQCLAVRLGYYDIINKKNIKDIIKTFNVLKYSKIGETVNYRSREIKDIEYGSKYDVSVTPSINISYEKSLSVDIDELGKKLKIGKTRFISILMMLGMSIMFESEKEKIKRFSVYNEILDDKNDLKDRINRISARLLIDSLPLDLSEASVGNRNIDDLKVKISLIDDIDDELKN